MMRKFDFEKNSIVEIVNEIIIDAIKKKASDIHFDPTPDFDTLLKKKSLFFPVFIRV